MNKEILWLLDNSLGKILRTFEGFLIRPRNNRLNLIDEIFNRSIHTSVDFVNQNLGDSQMFSKNTDIWDYCLETSEILNKSPAPLILEFGVYKGNSINYFAERVPNAKLVGFDSFEGLSENWTGFILSKGHFNQNGIVPKVHSNVNLVKGWFENTLPNYVKSAQLENLALLHLDADTYSPTKFVLETLCSYFKPGLIILFDEFFGYPNWQNHEFKAWIQVTQDKNISFKYIAFGEQQVAVQIL